MKKYDLKRAVIELVEVGLFKKEKDLFRGIKIYQGEIENLGPNVDRIQNKTYKSYQEEIQMCRQRTKMVRAQKFLFDVYVKQYQRKVRVAWDGSWPYGAGAIQKIQGILKDITDDGIRKCRMGRQPQVHIAKFGGTIVEKFGSKEKGRVFAKGGEVLRIYVEKNIKSLYADKQPTEPRKYVGIELEFCASIKENEFAVKLFKAGIHKYAQLKKDGSLRPYDNETGYELAILLEESNYKKRLKKITDLLAEIKAVAQDRRAGLHVHLDMRRRNRDIVYNNFVACQHALLSVVDPKRYNNEFCRLVMDRKFPTEFTGERTERYKTINAAAFYKYKTLEIRMHEGSVDFVQVSNWVDLLIKVANYSKKLKNDVPKIDILGRRIPLDKKLFKHMQDRSCFWQVNNPDRIGHAPARHEGLSPDQQNHVQEMRARVAEFQERLATEAVDPIDPRPQGTMGDNMRRIISEAPWHTVAVQAPPPLTQAAPGATVPTGAFTTTWDDVPEVDEDLNDNEEEQ